MQKTLQEIEIIKHIKSSFRQNASIHLFKIFHIQLLA